MTDAFKPTYFLDFYEKFPAERRAVMELNRDMWSEEEKMHHRLFTYNFFTAVPLFAYTAAYGAPPIFRKFGRVLGTHRALRHHAYIAGIASYMAVQPFYSKLRKTEAKLKEVDEYKVRTEGEFIEPTKPVSYNYKHY